MDAAILCHIITKWKGKALVFSSIRKLVSFLAVEQISQWIRILHVKKHFNPIWACRKIAKSYSVLKTPWKRQSVIFPSLSYTETFIIDLSWCCLFWYNTDFSVTKDQRPWLQPLRFKILRFFRIQPEQQQQSIVSSNVYFIYFDLTIIVRNRVKSIKNLTHWWRKKVNLMTNFF